MRPTRLLLLPFLLGAAPLTAQDFEGVLSLQLASGRTSSMEWNLKRGKSLATFALPDQRGDAGPEMRYLVDNGAHTSTAFIKMPSGSATGFKLATDLRKAPLDTSGIVAKPRKLGTSQTIAGIPCDDYELGDAAKSRACMTTQLGAFVYPTGIFPGGRALPVTTASGGGTATIRTGNGSVAIPAEGIPLGNNAGSMRPASPQEFLAGGRGRNVVGRDQNGKLSSMRVEDGDKGPLFYVNDQLVSEEDVQALIDAGNPLASRMMDLAKGVASSQGPSLVSTPPWSRAMHGLGFPLKVWGPKGNTILEVTTAIRGAIDEQLFVVPSGYVDAPVGGARRGEEI